MNRLYIRHAVGSKLLLDTDIHGATYKLREEDGRWTFLIDIADQDVVEQVLHFKDHINIFVVSEADPKDRTWYYSSDGAVSYDANTHKLTIVADSKMDYVV